MNLTKAEKAVIAVTLLFAVFALGVHLGSRRNRDEFRIVTEKTPAAAATGELPPPPETTVERVAVETAAPETGRVNINTAGVEELTTLEGIGEKLAERIVQYREEHGPFEAIVDITRVPGIGNGIYSKICTGITVE